MWKDADAAALLTIEKNCEENIQARIGNCVTAAEEYKELKKAYEGRTMTEFYALLESLTSIPFDDRTTSINEHISNYERTWNSFVGVISRADLSKDNGFGKGLLEFSKSDTVKAEFLLKSLPHFYSNTVENIRAKDYGYDDVARKLREFVPARQQRSRREKPEGTAENPVVLKTKEKGQDNGTRCDYCIQKGWKGLNHVESECYTKKREQNKKEGKSKKAKGKGTDDEDEDGVSICYVKVKGANAVEPKNHFEYNTGTSHHTTNRLDLLEDIEDISMTVEAHDKSNSICHKKGTLVFRHNNTEHRLQKCLYNPSYSNFISGQRKGTPYTLEVDSNEGTLKEKGRSIYDMKVDGKGAMWIKVEKQTAINKVTNHEELAKELHKRYGHISFNTLRTLPEYPKEYKDTPRCEACENEKATKPPARDYKKEGIRTCRPLE